MANPREGYKRIMGEIPEEMHTFNAKPTYFPQGRA
jgi:hypothetical protein